MLLTAVLAALLCLCAGETSLEIVDESPYCEQLARVTHLCYETFIEVMCKKTCFNKKNHKLDCGVRKAVAEEETKYSTVNPFQRSVKGENDPDNEENEKSRTRRHVEKLIKDLSQQNEKNENRKNTPNNDESIHKKNDTKEGVRSRVRRVAGGREPQKGAWPWHLALYHSLKSDQKCAGSLLTPEWLITTASCFDYGHKQLLDVEDWLVVGGEHSLYDTENAEQVKNVKRIILHPDNHKFWKEGFLDTPDDYDIALVKLQSPMKITNYIRTACLPSNDDPTRMHDCYVAGWGDRGHGGRHDAIHEAAVRLVSKPVCNLPSQYKGKIHDRAVCAHFKKPNSGLCEFDVGGALSCKNKFDNRWYSVGLSSWGFYCGEKKNSKFSAYTNLLLQRVRTWIIQTVLSYDAKTNALIPITERIKKLTDDVKDLKIGGLTSNPDRETELEILRALQQKRSE